MAKRNLKAQFKAIANGEASLKFKGGALGDPVNTLFGSEDKVPDLVDFFGEVNPKKKTLTPKAVTLKEALHTAYNCLGKSSVVDPDKWKALASDKGLEVTAASSVQLLEIAEVTSNHYNITSVASGFDCLARLMNLKPILKDMGWHVHLPAGAWEQWDLGILICAWVIYEGLGLSGADEGVLLLWARIQEYSRLGEYATWCSEYEGNTLYEQLYNQFVDVLSGEAIKPELLNPVIFEMVMFAAHLRGRVGAIRWPGEQGIELTAYQKVYSYGKFDANNIEFFACVSQFLRGAAQGRIEEDVYDDEEGAESCLSILLGNHLDTLVAIGNKATSVGTIALVDLVNLHAAFKGARKEALAAEEMM